MAVFIRPAGGEVAERVVLSHAQWLTPARMARGNLLVTSRRDIKSSSPSTGHMGKAPDDTLGDALEGWVQLHFNLCVKAIQVSVRYHSAPFPCCHAARQTQSVAV